MPTLGPWTSRAPADRDWIAIAWSPSLSLFAAVAVTGTGTRVTTSPDGVTWTLRTTPADNNWRGIAWSSTLGLFAAVAYSGTGNRVMTSPDGITWTLRTSASDNDWRAITWAPALGLFAAVANSGTGTRVMTSSNGITWTTRTSAADNGWLGIAWSPALGLFAAVSNDGTSRVMTSPDGTTWTSRTAAAALEWLGVTWSPSLGLFAAVASTGAGNRVMTSPDGITWTSRTTPADHNWRSIAWAPSLSLFAAVAITGTGSRAMTSPDGIVWTLGTTPTDNDWRAIAWAPSLGVFAAVASSGTGTRVMTAASVPDTDEWLLLNDAPAASRIRRQHTAIQIKDVLNNAPNMARLTVQGHPGGPGPLGGSGLTILDPATGDRIYKGSLQTIEQTYDGRPTQLHWDVAAIDATWRLNKYRPFGMFFDVSASDIAVALLADFAPGFTTDHVQTTLAPITIAFDGTQTMGECLTAICQAIGTAHWYVDYDDDLHLFRSVPPDLTPAFPPAPTTAVTLSDSSTNTLTTPGAVDSLTAVPAGGMTAGGVSIRYALSLSDGGVYSTLYPGGGRETPLGPPTTQIASGTDYYEVRYTITAAMVGYYVHLWRSDDLGPYYAVIDPIDNPSTQQVLLASVGTVAVVPDAFATAAENRGFGIYPYLGPIGAVSPAGFAQVSVLFAYADGTVSAPGPLSEVWRSDGTHYLQIDDLPIGTPAGTHGAVVARWALLTLLSNNGGPATNPPAPLGIFRLDDNVTTSVDWGFGQPVAPPLVAATRLAPGVYPPVVTPLPDGPTPACTVAVGAADSLDPTEFAASVTDLVYTFAVTAVYDDGVESLPGPWSDPVTDQIVGGPLKQFEFSAVPVAADYAGHPCLYRKIYARVSYTDPALGVTVIDAVVGWLVIPDNTTTACDETDRFIRPFAPGFHADPLPVTARVDGPDLESGDAPDPITTATSPQLLLDTPPITLTEDSSQIRTRVFVRGAGTSVAGLAILTSSIAAATVLETASPHLLASGMSVDIDGHLGATPAIFGTFVVTVLTPTTFSIPLTVTVAGTGGTMTPGMGATALPVVTISLFEPGGGQVMTGVTVLSYHGVNGTSLLLSAPLTAAIPLGQGVSLWVQRDDLVAQAELGAIELDADGTPTDGVHEFTVVDTSLRTVPALTLRGDAELALFSRPIRTVTYATRDPKSKSGQHVDIDLDDPPIVGTFVIQDVTIDQIQIKADLVARYTVTASSVRFTLDDLLQRVLLERDRGASSSSGSGVGAPGSAGSPGPTGPTGPASAWGTIPGTLSAQTDLQTALDAKAALVHTHVEADVTGLVADLAAKVNAAALAWRIAMRM
jgi:hypothetical protein